MNNAAFVVMVICTAAIVVIIAAAAAGSRRMALSGGPMTVGRGAGRAAIFFNRRGAFLKHFHVRVLLNVHGHI
ncbi:hypothetical protein FACS1894109_16050 [Spirochaetia bacterium]|nr:hypothetical protein FACS1894109_16050 [Spirochaetia bacterium]